MPHLPSSTSRHAAHRHRARARRRTRAAVVALTAAAGAAVTLGPIAANASTGLPTSPSHAPATTGQPATTDLTTPTAVDDAFGRMLADARDRAVVAARAERLRELAERRERKERLAKHRARALAAEVRASRASLRSSVVRPISGGYRLTARFHDGGGLWESGAHTGLDFACGTGTPVHVVADGVIVSAGYDGAYGNRIEVRHADGTVTTYSHLSAVVARSGRVRAGQVIGRVGSTGNVTGAHLHFEVMHGTEYVDPEKWLRARYVAY